MISRGFGNNSIGPHFSTCAVKPISPHDSSFPIVSGLGLAWFTMVTPALAGNSESHMIDQD
jgi:hypothetical protein